MIPATNHIKSKSMLYFFLKSNVVSRPHVCGGGRGVMRSCLYFI